MYGIKSSNIASIGWENDQEAGHGVARVQFVKGDIYEYYPIPYKMWEELWEQPSNQRSKWIMENLIRNKKISYEKLDQDNG